MRICPGKLKQFRGNLNPTVNCSGPLGSQKKADDSHLMKDNRKGFANVASSTSTIEPCWLTLYPTHTFYFDLNLS